MASPLDPGVDGFFSHNRDEFAGNQPTAGQVVVNVGAHVMLNSALLEQALFFQQFTRQFELIGGLFIAWI